MGKIYELTWVIGGEIDRFVTESKEEANNKFTEIQKLQPSIRALVFENDVMIREKYYGAEIDWNRVDQNLYALYKIYLEAANFTGKACSAETLCGDFLTQKQVLEIMTAAAGEDGYGTKWVYFPVLELMKDYYVSYSKK